jgi:SRSO17 transposase
MQQSRFYGESSEFITELIEFGFNIELVLADSFYGESSEFIKKITEYSLARSVERKLKTERKGDRK